jgi:hypothetical protein
MFLSYVEQREIAHGVSPTLAFKGGNAGTNRCCLLTIPEFKVPLRPFDEDEAPTPSLFFNDQSLRTNTLCFTPNH